MLFSMHANSDFSLYAARRKDLVSLVSEQYPKIKEWSILISSANEQEYIRCRPNNSFVYFTGFDEPGAVLMIDSFGHSTVYVPQYNGNRKQWVMQSHAVTPENSKQFGLQEVAFLGDPVSGYSMNLFAPQTAYSNIIRKIEQLSTEKKLICAINPSVPNNAYSDQQIFLLRLNQLVPGLMSNSIDISACVSELRRRKDMREIEQLYKAVEITHLAQEAAAQAIKPGVTEAEVQASLEYIMIASQSVPAFPSIVAGGKNGTILHYNHNEATLGDGDLVVVDIGARYNHYCADITRTYPVSGTFTKRQRDLYQIVLDTQEYIAEMAKPGYWLSNKDLPEKSLHHLAKDFLSKHGLHDYFIHGIGHFLGMDIHDVGDTTKPLQDGDVITIEPGIYLPEEKIGIRIEDNYWLVKDDIVCLSEELPKNPEDIEQLMAGIHNEEEEDEIVVEEDEDIDLDENDAGYNMHH